MNKKKQSHTRQQLLKLVSISILDTRKEKTKTKAHSDLKTQKSPPLYSPLIFIHVESVHLIIDTPTPIPKIDMRKFDGKDPATWILQMEQFFDLNNVPHNFYYLRKLHVVDAKHAYIES